MTEQNRSSARSRIFGVARIAIGLGLLYYLVVSGALDWRSLGGLVAEWPLTFAAGGLLVGALFLIAWRLCLLLHAPGFSDGFTALWEHGRLDLTMEARVIREPWSSLFTAFWKSGKNMRGG